MDIPSFAAHHGLDEAAVNALENLTPDVLEEVFNSFRSEGSDNASARLVSFVKNMVPGRTRGSGHPGRTGRMNRIEEFAARWGLDDRAAGFLMGCAQDVQNYCIDRFNPDTDVININAAFMSYIKLAKLSLERAAVERGEVGYPPQTHRSHAYSRKENLSQLAQFVRTYKLDTDACALLLDLPNDIRDNVVDGFQPPANGDFNKLFTSFALSRWKGPKRNDNAHFGMDDRSRISRPLNPPPGLPTRKRGSMYKYEEFIDRFGLDGDSVELLENLPGDTAQNVMADFKPPANTESVNKLFMTFARNQRQIVERTKGPRDDGNRDMYTKSWAGYKN